MSRVSRRARLAVPAGFVLVVGGGVYIGLWITDQHQGDNGRRLAALDHENTPAQVRQYRAAIAEFAASCGEDATYLTAAVVVAKQHRAEATAWGMVTSVAPNGLKCSTQLIYYAMGTGAMPQTLPAV